MKGKKKDERQRKRLKEREGKEARDGKGGPGQSNGTAEEKKKEKSWLKEAQKGKGEEKTGE